MCVKGENKTGKGTVSVWSVKILARLTRQVLSDKIMTLGNRERRPEDMRKDVMWVPRKAFQ